LSQDKKSKTKSKTKIVIFSPGGDDFDTSIAKKSAKGYTDIIFICGRYEGIDARVKKILRASEWSIGNYVLTGGELPAMVCIDSISRQIKGVLNDENSLEESRVSTHEIYARPEVYEYNGKKYTVPKVLLSGNHKEIENWRNENNLKDKK
jgi:tRNA (guanine37-N1)-methyltransferase